MEALYSDDSPDPAELAVLGLLPEDFPPPEFELWADNWPAIELFTQNASQWRTGPGGAVGLDYGVFHHELDRKGVIGDAFDEMMAAIRVIEGVALKHINRKD